MDDDLPDLPHYKGRKDKLSDVKVVSLYDSDDSDDFDMSNLRPDTRKKSPVHQQESSKLSDLRAKKVQLHVPVTSKIVPMKTSEKYEITDTKPSVGQDKKRQLKKEQTEKEIALARMQTDKCIEEMEKDRALAPNSAFRARWDVVMIVLLLYTALAVPYEIAFLYAESGVDFRFVWNRIVDCLFLCDMGFNFITPYNDRETGQLITSRTAIARRYFRGWFWIDLMSILPFDVVGLLVESAAVGQLKILRVVRFIRLLKLARVFRASRIFSRWESALGLTFAVLKLVKFVFGVLLLGHWMACLWGAIPQFEGEETGDVSWLQDYELGTDPWTNYIASLYWAVMTLTTIGYGDVLPQTSTERGVCIICMMIGGGVYAYVVGAVCGIVASMDEATTEFNQQMDHLNVYMDKVKAPKDMKIELRTYFLHSKDLLQHKYFSRVVNVLSPGLRGAFSNHTNGAWVRKIPFFVGGPQEEDVRFVADITQKIQAELYPPQEAIIHVGDSTNKMYIVSKGLVARLGRVMGKGNIFGEDVVLSQGTRHYSVLTLTYVDVYSLSRDSIRQVLRDGSFPHKEKNIKRAAVYLALKRRLQHLYSELQVLRRFGGSSGEDFERNWLRLRLLGKVNEKGDNPNELHLQNAIEAAERCGSFIRDSLTSKVELKHRDCVEASATLVKSAIDLLERAKKQSANKSK